MSTAQITDGHHFSISLGRALFSEMFAAALPYTVAKGEFDLTENLRQIARQEAELLAGLDGRTYQQDASDLLTIERLDRRRDRQIGLAGARRANTEIDVMAADAGDITLLVEAAGLDQRSRRPDEQAAGFDVAGFLFQRLDARLLKIEMHCIRRQLVGLDTAVERADQRGVGQHAPKPVHDLARLSSEDLARRRRERDG